MSTKNYAFLGSLIILFLLILRIRSVFRIPITVTFPFDKNTIILLIIILFFFLCSVYFSIKLLLGYTFFNKRLLRILARLDFINLALKNFHLYIAHNYTLYGKLCNFLNITFQYGGICKYPFVFILVFSVIPLSFFIIVLIVELFIFAYIKYTLYMVPLLLFPIIGRTILYITLDFLNHNLERLKSQLVFFKCSLANVEQKGNDIILNNSVLFNLLNNNKKKIFRVIKINSSISALNNVELFYLYNLFDAFYMNLSALDIIFTKYNKIISLLKDIIFIIIILYLLYRNIFI